MTVLKDGTSNDVIGYNIRKLIAGGMRQKQAEITAEAHARKHPKPEPSSGKAQDLPVMPNESPKGF